MSYPMTRLEQETWEILSHNVPRIASALERIAKALEHTVVKEDTTEVSLDEDTINRQYKEFLDGLESKEAQDGDNAQESRDD